MPGVEFPIPITAGALAVALIGNGGWSPDAALRLTYPDWLIPAWLIVMLAGDVTLLVIRAVRQGSAEASARSATWPKLVLFHRIGLDLSSRPVDRHHVVLAMRNVIGER